MTSIVTERLFTEDEFLALPSDPEGRKRELLDGRVVCLSHAGEEHSTIARLIFFAISTFAASNRLGHVFFDVGFKIRSSPDRVVSPDVSFVAEGVLDPSRDRRKAIPVAPALAVEVVSPNDRDPEVLAKVREYLAAGSARIWVVRPVSRTVTVHRPDGTARTLDQAATLSSDDAGFSIEGFSLPVAAVFEQG